MFVTAQRAIDTFDRTVRAGGDDFMMKPFGRSELLGRVHAALELRRLSAERNRLYAQVKQQRDDHQRLQLQKEQVVAFLVHDLKNHVHTIDLYAQLVVRDLDATERILYNTNKIRAEGRSLARMISTLLDIASADEGRLAPARRTIELSALVASAVSDLETMAEVAAIGLVSAIDVGVVFADPDLLRRVLDNLIENAIRHAPEGSNVRVTAQHLDGGVVIRVHDAGPGVPIEQREHVFERFVKGGDSSRGNRGLGLAFCKVAMDAHGGRIWVEDGEPGAVFCVWLAAAT